MSANNGFTPTQRRILDLLSDGAAHTKQELIATCLNDELSEPTLIHRHLSAIRTKLRPIGQDILFAFDKGVSTFRHIRVVPIKAE